MKFTLEIWDYMCEMDAFMYFGVRLWIGKFNAEVSIYKTRNGMLLFKVDLPLIHITNTMYRQTIAEPVYPTDGPVIGYFKTMRSKIKPTISGKVFGYKIKISD